MDTMKFYREKLLDHYHHPRNAGQLKEPDFSSEEYNHSCGDQVRIEGRVQNGVITDLVFLGSGCVISQAAASMITEFSKGKSIDEILSLDKDSILKLIGVQLGPTRLRCALLPLFALQHGLKAFKKEQDKS